MSSTKCQSHLFGDGYSSRVGTVAKSWSGLSSLGLIPWCYWTHRAERLMQVKSVSAASPPVGIVWKLEDLHLSCSKSSRRHGEQSRYSLVVKASDRGWHITSLSPVPLKTRRVGERCTLHLSKAETSSRGLVWKLGEGVPAQVSPSLLDHGSKL
ncbi:hypothetical protein TNCV_931861 [Trichonephila clavipes]|nr:hypothetical protein TNCV_931861 [Trichonephila clavipes]